MNILDKFSSVEIKADNRISDDDRAFCARHQEAFDKSGPALKRIAEAITEIKTEQKSILGDDGSEYSYLSNWGAYISDDEFKCDEDSVYKVLQKRIERFVTNIVDYFHRKYILELDADKIKEHLIPAPPKAPDLPYGGYRSMTDEEVDAYKEKLEEYEVEKQKYEASLYTFPLRYEQIVDEIFVQLGGFSFQERAMNEFLAKCWKAVHNRWDHAERFEIKNDTLKLDGFCWYDSNRWMTNPIPEYKPSEGLRIVLNSLVHFDIGQLNRGAEWFPELFYYSTKENIFPVNNLGKVKQIRLFKNGRVDIKFKDAVSCQEFVENYLRKKAI